ncbi:MAG: efflux RND transporter periplasmic adaptor subunit [gamma proteobacterium symbiont of Bathyaustriella thionipta]|nr:efflux RND transporter periplasmic adaptor subunit [gamma proteobacterium symbiont of Bathyaustriella thionipta]
MKNNNLHLILNSTLLALLLGSATGLSAATEDEKEILYWVAPMDANYRRDKPGKSPMGMELVPVYAGAADEGSSITIKPEVIQNLGIRTTLVKRTRLWRAIDTVGYVSYDESLVSHIHLRTAGWIENLSVRSEGERVKKGQRLFDLYSPDLVNAQEEYVQALSGKNRSLKMASRERLAALGVSKGQIDQVRKTRKVTQTIPVFASQNGIVDSLKVRDGMYVKPSARVMSLADLSSIWLMAEVFERQSDWVKVGQSAEMKLSYLPGKIWQGEVEYIYPSLDAKTRTLRVRTRFDNPNERLKPNMYADVRIYGGPKNDVLAIPLEALIRTGENSRVIVMLGDGRFEAREVGYGMESDDWVEILYGLKSGERVVTSGQFLLDSEASTRAGFSRMQPLPDNDMAAQAKADDMAVEDSSGRGVIQSVDSEGHAINLSHEPIEALGWPAMTMDFKVSPELPLDSLSSGESIEFSLRKTADGYVISRIKKIAE